MSVVTISSLQEYRKLLEENKKVAIDFHAEWCGPCKLIGPKFEKFAEQYSDITYARVDVDAVPDVAAEMQVRAMPTFVFYKDGEKIMDLVGANAAKLEECLKKLQEL